jgi:xanthine dehydrogenase large subunit
VSAVGKNLPHDSARGHVSGESIYIDDMPPARGELIVDFYYSPVAHGRIRSLSLDDARKIPGVVALFTHRDLAHNLFGPIIVDELLLAEDVVSFIGHPIVVIAAESREALKAAKAAIRAEFDELEPVFTIEEAKQKKLFIGPRRHIRRGDVAAAFASAEHILEGTFVNGGQDHFYLESQAALAVPGEFDQLTVHSSTQNPSEVQHVIAHLLGLPINKVNVLTKRMGGGFGGKECQATHPAAMAALVAHKTKRPARIAYNKDDDMRVTGGRHPFRNDYKVAFTSDGTITGMRVDLYSDGGAFADLSTSVMGRAMTHAENAYFIPNVEIYGTVCRTNLPPNTAFRGFGGPQGALTMENILEEIAVYLRKDPLEIRMRNCYGIDERNITPYGQRVDRNHLPRLFAECSERAGYAQRRAGIDAFNAASRTHLRGLAATGIKFGISFNTKFLNQANALVNVYLDGSVQVSTGATEMGQGVNTKIRQIVADEFAIDPELVIVMTTSTEKNNNTSATAASSGADLNGSAAADACRKIRARLESFAAGYFARVAPGLGGAAPSPSETPEDAAAHIRFENGQVFDARNPSERVPWAALIKMAYLERIPLGERGFYATKHLDWDADTGCGTPFLYFTQGVAISEVEIDRFTGAMRVLRSDLLMDIGKPINPGIDRGQLTGAFVQGMGWLTTEEMRRAPNGELLSHSPTTYKIPNIQDLPAVFNVDWIDVENPINLRSSKAVGEPPLLGAISIFMAVKNALSYVSGGEIPKIDAPATGEEILMRLTHYAQAARQQTPHSGAA